ncbi:MAG: hypothetical protein CEE38_06070 [Planctomycetes bacterium B3_Pla]|nr:MAG: hypothetical protein CEE38_06070 [Planctomycetes bacterium B3_Pla]
MSNNIETIVLVPIFVILLVVIFKPIRSAFNLDMFPSCVLSVCVSALCIIGMSRSLEGSLGIILLPYAALGIAILLILLFSFIGKHFKGAKDRLSDYTIRKDDTAQANDSPGQCADAFGVPNDREKSSGIPEAHISTRVPKRFSSRISSKVPVCSGHLRINRKNRTNNKRLKRR